MSATPMPPRIDGIRLRVRVSMSAIGSLRMGLPARLHDAGHLALERQLAEAQTTHLELPEIAARAAAELAPVVGAGREFRFPLRFHDERRLGHTPATP